MTLTLCPICGSTVNYKVLYEEYISPKDINSYTFSARRLPDRLHFRLVKCTLDGLVRSNPAIPDSQLSSLYRQSLFTYTQEIANLTNTYLRSLVFPLKRVKKTDSILEIGCGNGFLISKLRKLGYLHVFGVEASKDAVLQADKYIRKKIKNTMFRPKLFRADTFKLILLFQTLDHISNPNLLLSESLRILKPGGLLVAFNHNIDGFPVKILGERSPIIDPQHAFLYSPQTLTCLLEKNGFSVLKVFSPANTISIRHLIWLMPLPKTFKSYLVANKSKLLEITFPLKLGNMCLIAEKSKI